MVIMKRRIINIERYFANLSEDKEFYVSVNADEKNKDLLGVEAGIDEICIVPQPIGPVTRFNLYGKEFVHTEKKKELREIERDFHIVDWHGTDHYGTCFQSRICYPKEYIYPPLTKIYLEKGIIRSALLRRNELESLKHTINLFLEIFGYCEITDKDEKPIGQNNNIMEVSWRILPPGKYPWVRAKEYLQEYFENAPNKNKNVLINYHKALAKHSPEFLAIGKNSFNGYVVYGYTSKDLFVFESNQLGNATYVFKGEWEKASKLTKYEIIKGNMCYKRIIHSRSWEETVERLFI